MQNKKIKLVETTQRTPEKISHRERDENVSRNHAKNIMRHHQKPKKIKYYNLRSCTKGKSDLSSYFLFFTPILHY